MNHLALAFGNILGVNERKIQGLLHSLLAMVLEFVFGVILGVGV